MNLMVCSVENSTVDFCQCLLSLPHSVSLLHATERSTCFSDIATLYMLLHVIVTNPAKISIVFRYILSC